MFGANAFGWPYFAQAFAGTVAQAHARLSQEAVEVLEAIAAATVFLSQLALEVAAAGTATARLSQHAPEVLRQLTPDPARLSQLAVEVLVPTPTVFLGRLPLLGAG